MPNPRPMKEIDYASAARLAAEFGYDQIVIIARKEGPEGGECVCHAGLTKRDALTAEAIAEMLKFHVMGWDKTDEAKELETLVRQAKKEMVEGPDGGDPQLGRKLIALPGER